MPDNFVVCVRDVKNGKFIAEPGETRFLSSADGAVWKPDDAIKKAAWVKAVVKQATTGKDPQTSKPVGDLLVFVHGYNNSPETVLPRHEMLRANLEAAGFLGAVVSFDWPSAELAIGYLEDRSDAKATALRLVDDCIALFAEMQANDCQINVHVLGHSTGAYVIREAFDDADDRPGVAQNNWTVSQLAFISGDVSSASMSEDNSTTESLYRHCVRMTNFTNRLDSVLKISNAKRVGLAPRVGRVGLPADVPAKAVDVDCSNYFATLNPDPNAIGSFDHSWQFADPVFAQDLFETIAGNIDRTLLPTRAVQNGHLILQQPE